MSRLTDSLDKNHQRGGLTCPFCGGKAFEVHRVTNNATNQIRRVRICKTCGRKVRTIEVIQGGK